MAITKGFLLFTLALFCFSCNKNAPVPDIANGEKGSYFSIRQFTQDQWNTFHGQPFSMVRTASLNNEKDSSIITSDDMDWGAIFKTFFESDISDKKFLDHYAFSMFNDDGTESRNFYYEAKDPDLFTRKLLISANQFTNKITSIYIETRKKTFWNSRSQKLYYMPLKLIQIQETEKSIIGPAKHLVVEYRFMI